MTEICP